MAKVLLACKTRNGMYPKFATSQLKRGLLFQNGIKEINDTDLKQLLENDDFKNLYGPGKEIWRVVKPEHIPVVETTKVVTSTTTTSGETTGASEHAAIALATEEAASDPSNPSNPEFLE